MRAAQLPAKRGLAWIIEGYRLFTRSPLLLVLLIFTYWFLMVASNIIPVVGPLIATVLIPTFSVGLMAACRALDQGKAVEMGQLFAGFRDNFPALLRLGFVYLASTVAILAASALVDGGTLMQMMLFGTRPPEDEAADERLLWAIELAAVLFIPVLMAFWFAPVLAAWHRMPAFKSLFFSFFACARNLRAFLVYGAVLVALTAVLPVAVVALFAAILKTAGVKLAIIVLMPVFFVLVATLFASFYVGYRDIFQGGDEPAAASATAPLP
jgi:hypothetical protein